MAGSGYYVAVGRSIQLPQPTIRSMKQLIEREEIPAELLPDQVRLESLIESGFVVTEKPEPAQPIPTVARTTNQGRTILSPAMEHIYARWQMRTGE